MPLWLVETDDERFADVRCAYQPSGQPQCDQDPTDWRGIPVGKGQIIALLCEPHARIVGMDIWTDRERQRRTDAGDHDHRPG